MKIVLRGSIQPIKIKLYTNENQKQILLIGGSRGIFSFWGCDNKTNDYYKTVDFEKVSKIDGHFHYDTTDIRYLEYACSLNFRLLSPNVATELPIDK